jgi:hypothetical protein
MFCKSLVYNPLLPALVTFYNIIGIVLDYANTTMGNI